MLSLQEYTNKGGMERKANEDDPELGNNRAPRYVPMRTRLIPWTLRIHNPSLSLVFHE